jgi:DinB family protein
MRTNLLAALLFAAPLSAQQLPSGFKEQQIADFERERRMTLAMVDSMPERFLHFKPVPEVRDFAQQIAHAAVPVSIFAAVAKGEKPPAVGDSTAYLNSKQALKEAVNKSYDYALGVLKGMSDADYTGTTTFAKAPRARWRIIELAHEHSVWTRGELVSYFRLNGMAPPAFDLFGSGSGE